jgi:chromosome segregation ATPase
LAHARQRIAQLEQHQVPDDDLRHQWDNERTDLQAALEHHQAQARAATRTQDELRNQLDDVMARLSAAQAGETARLTELHQSRNINAGLRQELAETEEDLHQARAAKAQALASVQHSGQPKESPQLQLEIRSLQSRLAHAQAALEESRVAEQQQQANSVETRQAELSQFQQLLADKNRQVKELQAALDHARRVLETNRELAPDTRHELAMTQLATERAQWRQQTSAQQQAVDRLHEQLQAQRLEVDTLRKMQLSDGHIRQQLEHALTSQAGELQQVRGQAQLLKTQVVALQRQLSEAHEASVTTDRTVVDNSDQLASLQHALTQAKQELAASKAKNQEVREV